MIMVIPMMLQMLMIMGMFGWWSLCWRSSWCLNYEDHRPSSWSIWADRIKARVPSLNACDASTKTHTCMSEASTKIYVRVKRTQENMIQWSDHKDVCKRSVYTACEADTRMLQACEKQYQRLHKQVQSESTSLYAHNKSNPTPAPQASPFCHWQCHKHVQHQTSNVRSRHTS